MKQKGFTLIELLVVIAIIGILTSLITVNLAGLQQRGRDSQRKSDLEKVRTAIERYYADTNSYPAHTALVFNGTSRLEGTINGQTVTYLDPIPRDPRTGNSYAYCVSTRTVTGSPTLNLSYRLFATLENTRDPQRYCGISAATNWSHASATCEERPTPSGSGITWNCTSGFNEATYNYVVREP